MDSIVHGVAKSWIRLSDFHFTFHLIFTSHRSETLQGLVKTAGAASPYLPLHSRPCRGSQTWCLAFPKLPEQEEGSTLTSRPGCLDPGGDWASLE